MSDWIKSLNDGLSAWGLNVGNIVEIVALVLTVAGAVWKAITCVVGIEKRLNAKVDSLSRGFAVQMAESHQLIKDSFKDHQLSHDRHRERHRRVELALTGKHPELADAFMDDGITP